MTIRQFINRIICSIDYFYYNKLLRKIERKGKVPLMMVPGLLKLSQKYGKVIMGKEMIPDKIYIAAQTFPNEIDWDGSPINTKKVEDTDVQYIRKDAILDILKNAKHLADAACKIDSL